MHGLAVAPAVMTLQQNQLAEQNGAEGVRAALLLMARGKVGGDKEQAAEALQDIVEGAHRIGLREKAADIEKRTLLCVDENHLKGVRLWEVLVVKGLPARIVLSTESCFLIAIARYGLCPWCAGRAPRSRPARSGSGSQAASTEAPWP